MELNEFVDKKSDEHVARSLEDSKDAEKLKAWTDGQRAREQAEQIVAEIISEALGALEKDRNDH